MCRKQKGIYAVKTKSSHSHCKRLYCTAKGFKAQQTALKHSKQLYCTVGGFTAESFTTRQKALMHSGQLQMHSRKLYCTARSFIVQQKILLHNKVSPAAKIGEKFLLQQKLEKSSFCGRKQRKVPSATETEDKPTLQHLSLGLGLSVCAQPSSGKMVL